MEFARAYNPTAVGEDIDAILHGRGRAYLSARARLEANPDVAIPVLRDRIGAPAPGLNESGKHRLLNVLGTFKRPEDLRWFADALVQSVAIATAGEALLGGPSETADTSDVLIEPWRTLIVDQGVRSVDVLVELVNDRRLPTKVRGGLLNDLVEVQSSEGVLGLVESLGRGDAELEAYLRRALAARGRRHATDSARLLSHISTAQRAEADPRRAAALLFAWGSLAPADDAVFGHYLADRARDSNAVFPVRVAAVRLLVARPASHSRRTALTRLASVELQPARRASQASEILGYLALGGLDPDLAREIVDRTKLLGSDAPRLASLAYLRGSLPEGDWLRPALENPWPQVRRDALSRVRGPCGEGTLTTLHRVATTQGADAASVARAAVRAMGRCGGPASVTLLEAILDDETADITLRAAAIRALVEGDPNHAAHRLATRLTNAPEQELASLLIDGIARAPALDEMAFEALCAAVGPHPRLARRIAQTLGERFPGRRCKGAAR